MNKIHRYGKVQITDPEFKEYVHRQPKFNSESTDWFYSINPRYGETIEHIMKMRKFTVESVLQLGIQIVRQLEAIHKTGFVHADIKPDNIVVGQCDLDSDKTMRARLIDFGISKRYKNSDGIHVENKLENSFTGSLWFTSPHVMDLCPPTRRDDMISLIYLLMYVRDILPFSNVENVQQ